MNKTEPIKYWFPYWGPFVIISQIEDEFVDLLLKKGKQSKKKSQSATSVLAGQIKNEYNYKNFASWFLPKFNPYFNAYCEGVTQYKPEAPFDWFLDNKSPENCWVPHLWINYQKAKEYNPPHAHSADISFVIYLQVPDEIKEEREKMRGIHNHPGPGMIVFDYGEDLKFSSFRWSHMPSAGELIMFPGWLMHHVHAFQSDVERISVSGNVMITGNDKITTYGK